MVSTLQQLESNAGNYLVPNIGIPVAAGLTASIRWRGGSGGTTREVTVKTPKKRSFQKIVNISSLPRSTIIEGI